MGNNLTEDDKNSGLLALIDQLLKESLAKMKRGDNERKPEYEASNDKIPGLRVLIDQIVKESLVEQK